MEHTQSTILLVDDEASVRGVLSDALHRGGFAVLEAGNYQESMQLIDTFGAADIGLLISDVSLPGTNGCELALAYLTRNPSGRVLFISGYTGAEVCRYYDIRLSDQEFLAKPIYPNELLERVVEILSSQGGGNADWRSRFIQSSDGEALQSGNAR